MARLPKKVELNYRHGDEKHRCARCNYFKAAVGIAMTPGGNPAPAKSRCKVIGLKHGKAYEVDPAFVCDAYDNSFILKKLRGETWRKDR